MIMNMITPLGTRAVMIIRVLFSLSAISISPRAHNHLKFKIAQLSQVLKTAEKIGTCRCARETEEYSMVFHGYL